MKKKNTFKVGDHVGAIINHNDYYEFYDLSGTLPMSEDEPDYMYGIVTALNADFVIVKWDSDASYYNDSSEFTNVNSKYLLLKEDLKLKLSDLESEFESLEKKIKVKMKEAGKLVKEAQKIVKKHGTNLSDMYEAVSPLVDAMDDSGWRSSSWRC